MDQITIFPVAKVKKLAPEPNIFIVISYYAVAGYWKIWKDGWMTIRDAEEFASKLPGGHTEARIYHLKGGNDDTRTERKL